MAGLAYPTPYGRMPSIPAPPPPPAQSSNDPSELAFQAFGPVDAATSNALQSFIANSREGTVQLPPDLQNMLTARYKAYNFKTPTYNPNIQSVADLPDNIKDALIARAMRSVNSTAEGQRQQAKDAMLRISRGDSGGMAAALRDINKAEMEQAGNVATTNMTDEANRAFEEAKTMRGLNIDDARFRAGLEDTQQTRQAAEAEKEYQSEYGREQDIINTIMNQAAFKSGEQANQASRQQAGIQQGMNYLGQAAAYRQNVQQLKNKGDVDTNIVGVPSNSYQTPNTPAPTYNKFQPTPFQQRSQQSSPYPTYQYQGGQKQ